LNSLEIPRPGKIFELVLWQTGFGPRYPGSEAHLRFCGELEKRFKPHFDAFHRQEFEIVLRGNKVACANLIGVKKTATAPAAPPLLIGTHFDTRPLADNEQDPGLKHKPIIGANDGGSGTAVLLALAQGLAASSFTRDIYLALFDAEDVGNIGGYEFGVGARYFTQHPLPGLPGEVIILDMVGGKNLILDIDLHLFSHGQSLDLARRIMSLGTQRGYAPFIQNKPGQHKYIICDHIPFLRMGIPSFVLIDIDYPQWHTHADLPQAMCEESLGMITRVVADYLGGFLIT
jgi:glutaminyl-peptide cyclotransferase